ncbi:hypothetical protein GGTG_01450 [Gaeumannomyces tritici R3-111a-1]|uniref:Uncharacterized protein n=1 Tax=Gaeumannomyces tritici (strain R3-111a-1) TaxID=644352 RepID=J3NJM0_GAET3|nr:hypothetical protein GGTG_01450 [Gaeumannomyces tritici R3-111a-1]EJT81472.1 hypothetical protein GGTG_01450 [Gaeumannomyces tritici R3-111a-1]
MCHYTWSGCYRCGTRLQPQARKLQICDDIRLRQSSLLVLLCCVVPPTRCRGEPPDRYVDPKPDRVCRRCAAGPDNDAIPPPPYPAMTYAPADRRVPGPDAAGYRTHERVPEPDRRERTEGDKEERERRRKLQKRKDKHRAKTFDKLNGGPDNGPQSPCRPARKKRGRPADKGNASSSTTPPRRFSVGEHTQEYYDTMHEAYRARGAPSRTPSGGGGGGSSGQDPESSATAAAAAAARSRSTEVKDSPPPLNLGATRYTAERRNAHLDHAHVLAAEHVSAARAGRPQRPARAVLRQMTTTAAAAAAATTTTTPGRYEFPPLATVVSSRPVRIVSPLHVERSMRALLEGDPATPKEERVDEGPRGTTTTVAGPSRIPCPPTPVAAPRREAGMRRRFGSFGGSRVPRCAAWLADDECLVMCSPGNCRHSEARRRDWLGRNIARSAPSEASSDISFVCKTSAKIECKREC